MLAQRSQLLHINTYSCQDVVAALLHAGSDPLAQTGSPGEHVLSA